MHIMYLLLFFFPFKKKIVFNMINFFDSKSLIKLVKNRIDVIRRKRNATQKFLKKDIADLLSNGLDINAYGRVIIYFFFFKFTCDLFFSQKKKLNFYEVAFSAVLERLEILGLLIFFSLDFVSI